MNARVLGPRVVPIKLPDRSRARYVFQRNLLVYRHVWIILFTGFFEPILYLFAANVGIGRLVGDVAGGANGEALSYGEFIAPALLAASAMNGAVYESTMNIFFKLKFAKVYDGMLATPLQPFDIALGEIAWSLARGAIYATGFIIVIAGMGLMPSAWGILALPMALLIGFAFAAVGMAFTTYMRSWQDFDMVNLALLVLFLFSATFFPITVYPTWLKVVAQLSPLYHGVVVIRALTQGTLGWTLIPHIAFLIAMAAAGLTLAGRRLEKLLTP